MENEKSKLCTTSGRPVDVVRAEQTEIEGQHKDYIILCDSERAKGFIRPVRREYFHRQGCGALTIMGQKLSETYARDPSFYGATFCVRCNAHFPVGEFVWKDGQVLGG